MRFAYEERRTQTGRGTPYNAVREETLELLPAIGPTGEGGDGSGIVYLLTNPSMPGLVKIGFTRGTAPQRAAQLSATTGVPTPFEIAWEAGLPARAREVEQRAHAILARKRQGKEFFKATMDEGREAVLQAISICLPDVVAQEPETLARAARRAARREALARAATERRDKAAFQRSPEGCFLRSGKPTFALAFFDPDLPRASPGLLDRLRRKFPPDWSEIGVELLPLIGDEGATACWSFRVEHMIAGVRRRESFSVATTAAMFETLEELMGGVANRRATVRLDNHGCAGPIPLEQDPAPRQLFTLAELREVIERAGPVGLAPEKDATPPEAERLLAADVDEDMSFPGSSGPEA